MMFVWADRCTANGECSDAMNYLTGGLVASYPTSDEKRAWDALQTCISGGAFASSSSRAIHSEAALREVGLVQGHAYSILHAIETSGKLRLVNLKNPCKQPNGSLSLVGCPPASGVSRGFVVAHRGDVRVVGRLQRFEPVVDVVFAGRGGHPGAAADRGRWRFPRQDLQHGHCGRRLLLDEVG